MTVPTKRGRGRPKGQNPPTKIVSMRLPVKYANMLKLMAKVSNHTQAQIVSIALLEMATNGKPQKSMKDLLLAERSGQNGVIKS